MRWLVMWIAIAHFLLAVPASGVAQDGFRQLFNGKDLTGWAGNPDLWSVEDGCIIGRTKDATQLSYNQFLIWDGTVADFELRCEFQLEGDNNSGVQYRSVHDREKGDFVCVGYQADIHGSRNYTGMMYDEKGRGILATRGQKVLIRADGSKEVTDLKIDLNPLDLKKWHELTIRAVGNHIVHRLDGVTVMDLVDDQESERELSGVLGLQVHRGPAMTCRFRNIRFKELTPEDVPGLDAAPPAVTPQPDSGGAAMAQKKRRNRDNPAPDSDANVLQQPEATPAESLKVAKGFRAELLYSVPRDQEGSWVNLCVDPKGRLITSDQYGSLYRITPAVTDAAAPANETRVEKINVEIGEAQGLLWAFDCLYVSVNRGDTFRGGLYRVRDTDGDDQLDSVEPLRYLEGRGEHGPHAILMHPDEKSLVIVCGNGTELTEISASRQPQNWDEDLLLPRVNGKFMLGKRAPGGCIYKVDPDGKQWELLASGFRNEFDAAFNGEGELFTYDADMEWDINAPWYRPTRICHAVSGAEFGWRSSSGKWPVYYSDSVPPVINIGPGSPTGVCFGFGAEFPSHYQEALYAADWSYGKLYAVHLKPRGATFTADLEEFVSGTPLPLTDVIVNPHDGAMYFTIGGRKVQSGLYRVTYTDTAKSAAAVSWLSEASARKTRRGLEAAHRPSAELTVDAIWPHLASSDRSIRYAARIALEHKPVAEWQDRALTETHPQASVTAIMALARMSRRTDRGQDADIDSPVVNWDNLQVDPARSAITTRVLKSIHQLGMSALDQQLQLDALRALSLTFVRIAPPGPSERARLSSQVRTWLPGSSPELFSELAQLAVYLQAPYAAEMLIPQLEAAPTQEEQIDIAKTLRHLKTGWTIPLRERYFNWYVRAATYRGGASFGLYLENMKSDAIANLTPEERAAVQAILDAKPASDIPVFTPVPRPFVREWKMAELLPLLEQGLKERDFDHGRQMFAAASCFACHRFDNQGGAVGPDLTLLSGRFSARDLMESIAEPSKVVSDQYESHQFVMQDGLVINGRIINLAGDSFRVQTNMLDPGSLTNVDRRKIEEMTVSKTSMMPTGLLNTLHEQEILDLFAYLLSRGDRTNPIFAK